MGRHSMPVKPVVILDDLGELSAAHDGSTVLVRAEVIVVHTTYLMVKDDTPIDRLSLIIGAKIGKGAQFPNGIKRSTVEDVLIYLDGLDESDPLKIDIFGVGRELVAV